MKKLNKKFMEENEYIGDLKLIGVLFIIKDTKIPVLLEPETLRKLKIELKIK